MVRQSLADHRADRKNWLLATLGQTATDPARYAWEPVAPDDSISREIGDRVIATAQFSEHAADGHGAWIVSCHPGRLFTRNQAITAMVLAERLAVGYGDDDPFVLGWSEELGL
jgi:hypothetical protein